MSRFARGTFYMTVAHVIFMGSGYLLQILLGRYFSPSLYGNFGVIIAFLNTSTTLTVSGIYQAVVRFVAMKPSASKTIVKTTIKLELLIVTLITLVILFFAKSISIIVFKDESLINPLRMVAFILSFYIFRSIFRGFLLGLKEYFQTSLILVIAGITKLLVVGLVVFLGYKLIGVLFGYLIAGIVGFLIGLFLFLKKDIEKETWDFNRGSFLKLGLMLTLVSFLTPFFENLSIFLLKYLEVFPDKIGFFNAAMTLGRLPIVFSIGLSGTILPAVSSTFGKKNFIKIKEQINDALRYSCFFLLPLVVVLIITSREVIHFVFSEKYLPASFPLSLILFGFFFFSLYNILTSILIALGKGKEVLIYLSLLVFVNFIFNFKLIPLYGIEGAAIASTISFFLAFIVFFVIITRVAGFFWFKSWLIKIPFANLIIGGLCLLFFSLINIENIFSYSIFLIFLAGIYVFILLILKEIKKRDIDLFKNLLFLDLWKIKNIR